MRDRAFRLRLRQLRVEKKVGQLKMSQDLMMSKNYIYNIEKGYAYPSMTQFFAICEYLDVAPYEFLKFGEGCTTKQEELLEAVAGFTPEQVGEVIRFAERLKKE